MEMVSKPCQDRFMVHSIIEKGRKYRWPNGAHQKKHLKNDPVFCA